MITGPVDVLKDSLVAEKISRIIRSGLAERCGLLVVQHPKDAGNNPVAKSNPLITDSVDDIHREIKDDIGIVVISGAGHYPDITPLIDSGLDSGRWLIGSGTNLDSEGHPYNSTPSLLARAHEIKQAKGVCSSNGCRNMTANRSIEIDYKYRAMCSTHFYQKGLNSNCKAGMLTVHVGGMFSGKSEGSQRKIKILREAGYDPMVFKLRKDQRCGLEDEIHSHDDNKYSARNVDQITDIDKMLQASTKDIIFDEGQFPKGIYGYVYGLLARGYNVDVTGLPLAFNRKDFGEMPQLMCLADVIELNHAHCVSCGHDAYYSQRMKQIDGQPRPAHDNDVEFLPAGDKNSDKKAIEYYEARCLDCLEIPGRPIGEYPLERFVR